MISLRIGAILVNLTGAYYYESEEAEQKDERTPVTKKWLRERGAKNIDTVEGIVEDLNLTGKNLQGANLQNTYLYKIIFTRANLTGAYLTEANLTEANLTGAYLTEANLTAADLTKADLKEANLYGAHYYKDGEKIAVTKNWLRERGAVNVDTVIGIVESTNLTEKNLHGADLRGFYLYKIIFTKANLTGADLTGADLTNANLLHAELQSAYYYENEEKIPVTKKWLKERGAVNVDTVTGIIDDINLTDVYLQEADLRGFFLYGAYYYKDKEAEKKDERTPVTKKWLRERGALNVDTVTGIPEE